MEFLVHVKRGDEALGFDEIAHELQDWARGQDDYEDDESDACAAEALAEALCTCHGSWPRSDTGHGARDSLRDTGSFRASFDNGLAVFEVRYAPSDEAEKPA